MIKYLAPLSIVVAILFGGHSANAGYVDICIDLHVQYVDHSTNHDRFNEAFYNYRRFRGGDALVLRGGTIVFDSFLNEDGCTGSFWANAGPSQYVIITSSQGKIGGNYMAATNNAISTADMDTQALSTSKWIAALSGSITTRSTVRMSPGPGAYKTFSVVLAALTAAYYDFGDIGASAGTSDDTTTEFYIDGVGSYLQAGGSSTFGRIQIGEAHPEFKFLIAHELGHAVARYFGVSCFSTNYSREVISCPSPIVGSSHGPGSQEIQGAAAGEGWAHFYAADAWNNHDQNDCGFVYYNPATPEAFTCEGATATFPTAYNKNRCIDSGTTITGNETDWMRHFWDVHTNITGHIPLEDIGEWLAEAGTCDAEEVYEELDVAANTVGSYVNAYWDALKCFNGIPSFNEETALCGY